MLLQREASRRAALPRGQARGLRAHDCGRDHRRLRRRRVLLGGHGLDAVRPRLRRPEEVPTALATTTRCAGAARSCTVSPYGEPTVPFSFDYSFNYYPLDYDHPGPEIVIYRLRETARMKRLRGVGAGLALVGLGLPNLIVWLGGRSPSRPSRARPARPGRARAGRAGQARRRAVAHAAGPHHGRRGALQGRARRQAAALRRPQPRSTTRSARCAGCCSSAASRPRTSSPTTRASTRGTRRSARGASSTSPRAVVVTQRFHMARALYDARRAGLEATGYARRPPRLRPRDGAGCGCARPPRG